MSWGMEKVLLKKGAFIMFKKIVAAVLALGFFGWCFVTGSEAESHRQQVVAEQQGHDLQQMRMSRISAGDMRYTK